MTTQQTRAPRHVAPGAVILGTSTAQEAHSGSTRQGRHLEAGDTPCSGSGYRRGADTVHTNAGRCLHHNTHPTPNAHRHSSSEQCPQFLKAHYQVALVKREQSTSGACVAPARQQDTSCRPGGRPLQAPSHRTRAPPAAPATNQSTRIPRKQMVHIGTRSALVRP